MRKLSTNLTGAILSTTVLAAAMIWSVSIYRSSKVNYRQSADQALTKAIDEELMMRRVSLGEKHITGYTPTTNTPAFITKTVETQDTVFSVRVKSNDPTATPKIRQFIYKDFLPINITHIDSLFKCQMTKESLSVKESYIEYLDLKKNRVLDNNRPEGDVSGYLVSNTDTLDILKTIGVRVYAKTGVCAILRPVMPQMIVSSALVLIALVCSSVLLRKVYRQRLHHETTVSSLREEVLEARRDAELAMAKLREWQAEEESKTTDRQKFHHNRDVLYFHTISKIIKNETTPMLIVKTRVAVQQILHEMQVKYEDNVISREVKITIPDSEFYLETDEKHFCNIIDRLFSDAVIRASSKVCIDTKVSQDEAQTEITIVDDGAPITPEKIAGLDAPYDPRKEFEESGSDIEIRYVKAAVQALGGTLHYEREQDMYTRVTLTFPKK